MTKMTVIYQSQRDITSFEKALLRRTYPISKTATGAYKI